jgi:glycosyltransferase involved in cell wall biosynthesis
MNILELCLSPGLGGLELYVFRSAQALAQKHNVIAVLNVMGKLPDHFREHSNIRSIHLNKSYKHLPLLNAIRLARIIDNEDIDAIHMHWGNDLALAALAKKISTRKPALIYTRQMKITRYKNDFYHRLLYRQMDLMLTITKQLESEAKMYIPVDENRITTLYYGVNAPDHLLTREEKNRQRIELGFNEDDFVIGLLGRLEQGKGQHLLIEALQMAKKESLDPKALIVGHEMVQGYRASLQDLADSLGLGNNIKFMDFVSEPQKLMQLCDCIALTSKEETFGLVLPEAMRCGVAVIGSNKGGVPEIISHEQTGLLFDSWNSSSLYKQIYRLYTEPEFRQKLASQGKAEANTRFDNDDHFAALEKHIIDATQRPA